MLEKLNRLNELEILSVEEKAFARYGRLVREYDFDEILRYMEQQTEIPAEGNCYIASNSDMEALPTAGLLQNGFYGGMRPQIGYCNGNNSKLNCMEYHKSSELDIAVTPLVLLLAYLPDLREGFIDSGAAQAFYLPAGTAVELYATTLHFSPCKVQDSGFKSVIVLPAGTNLPLTFEHPTAGAAEDRLLWMTNKWLVTLPDTPQAQKGAFQGIRGRNITIAYKNN